LVDDNERLRVLVAVGVLVTDFVTDDDLDDDRDLEDVLLGFGSD
jgi:hypothetical protein